MQIVKVMGGLGNQMFAYAFALALRGRGRAAPEALGQIALRQALEDFKAHHVW